MIINTIAVLAGAILTGYLTAKIYIALFEKRGLVEAKDFSLSDKLPFGKYKGLTIEEIIEDNPSYIDWAVDEIESFWLDEIAEERLIDSLEYNIKRKQFLDNIV